MRLASGKFTFQPIDGLVETALTLGMLDSAAKFSIVNGGESFNMLNNSQNILSIHRSRMLLSQGNEAVKGAHEQNQAKKMQDDTKLQGQTGDELLQKLRVHPPQ